jgi:hypothetical protein
MGIGDRLIGDNMMQEIEKRMKMITNELCPRMDALIREQQKTNEILSSILLELRKK